MRSENFEKTEALVLVLLLLFNQLFNQLFKLGLAGFGDQWLFKQNLVNQSINVRPVTVRDKC